MPDFIHFAKQVENNINNIKTALFKVNLSGDELWDIYLNSFPKGTNEIFRTRRYHDASYDKNFIRQFGNVVYFNDSTMVSIWECTNLPEPYQTVSEALKTAVLGSYIIGSFYTKEPLYGHKPNIELIDNKPHTWNHFFANVPNSAKSNNSSEKMGEVNSIINVFKGSLDQITLEAANKVIELINENNLYRGAEFKNKIVKFINIKNNFIKSNGDKNFIWYSEPTRIKNSVIGTLLVDISNGVSIEKAVKAFEFKVAPTNYKRPKALITQSMVDEAEKIINDLELDNSFSRKMAELSEININDILWSNANSSTIMKGKISNLLSSNVTKKQSNKVNTEVETITIDQLMNLLVNTKKIEIFKNKLVESNLVTLTTSTDLTSPNIMKWDNNFAWSYKGNMTDSDMRQAVIDRGGSVDGVFRFTHSWNHLGQRNASLMDLHVFLPSSNIDTSNGINNEYGNLNRVGWNNREDYKSKGVQDVDYTNAAPLDYIPVENITFPSLEKMPNGSYICKIHNWMFRAPTTGGFKTEIEFEGNIYQYEYNKPLSNNEWVTVAVVTLNNGQFSIEHHIEPVNSNSIGSFIEVDTIMLSPNYWGSNSYGNKHYFFISKECNSDEPVNGIYNEFIDESLGINKRVIEVLGTKTKCPVIPNQLSGLGFSSTKKQTVNIKLDNRPYILSF